MYKFSPTFIEAKISDDVFFRNEALGVGGSTVICDRIVNIEDFLSTILAVIPPEIFYSLSQLNTGIVSCINYKHKRY